MKDGKTTRHARVTCPACKYRMDASTPLEGDASPEPGCFSICLKCGELSRYGQDLQLEQVSTDEMLTMPLEQREYLVNLEERAKAIIAKQKALGGWIGQRK